MAPSPEGLVRAAYDAWTRQDDDALKALTDPAIVIDASRRTLNPAVFDGHEGLRQLIDETRESWERFDLIPHRVGAKGDLVAAEVDIHAHGRTSGADTTARTGHLWTVRDGRLARCLLFVDVDEAFAALRDG